MWLIVGIVVVVILLLILYVVWVYNQLITLRNRVENGWSQIDVQLKRRYDLIPNLVNIVKGYAKHEKTVFQNVTKMRTAALNAKTPGAKAEAENMLTGALKSLFAVAENYPQLKANENFKELQKELEETENKIMYARQFYNDTVMKYNMKVQYFPSNIIANMFKFGAREYFKAKGEEKEVVNVEF